MNYCKIYESLINSAANDFRLKGEVYYESHHIVPKCMGGSDEQENIVLLTAEEHYVAHQLLCKMHPENRRLIYAAKMMTVESGSNFRSGNKLYGWLKRKFNELNSRKRVPRSDDTRRKISESLKGNTNSKGKSKGPLSEEHKRKIGESQKGKICKPTSDDTKRKISESMKGKTHSLESKRKMSEAKKGRRHSEETKHKISESMKGKKHRKFS